MADITFKSQLLADIYNGTAAGSPATTSQLNAFRDNGTADLIADIASIDQRIAAFESVIIGNAATGKSSAEFPYDRDGLRREFLDEITALLLRRGYGASGIIIGPLGELAVSTQASARGNYDAALNRDTGTTGWGVFDNLATDGTTASNDPRLNMLTPAGKDILASYINLIDAAFEEGNRIGANSGDPVQLVSAIVPITVDGVTYDAVAQVSGIDGNGAPAYDTYLLEAGTTRSIVRKGTSGEALLDGPASSTSRRLELAPQVAAWNGTEHVVTVDGLTFRVSTTNGVSVRTTLGTTPVPADPITPLLLNLPGDATSFPNTQVTSSYRYTASNGSSYLIGLGSDGKVYVTSLADSHRTTVGTTPSLSSLEYLLYYNEARIEILRAQLAYREAVVREIQEDLKQANHMLSVLEVQAGFVTATNSEGQPTGQLSAETLEMSLFNATHSRAGDPIFRLSGEDNWHGATEWQANRTYLKNYIDRRSAEAQEATLDYQNTLNRFNNAFEVMAKLQEKLDTLLKGQLRNIG